MRTSAARLRGTLVLLVALQNAGCALLSKSERMTPRYFSPSSELARAGSPKNAPRAALELRLGAIDSAAHLEERIAYRLSDSELGYYDDRRWTEPPEEYLRRALGHELFETRGLSRVVAGAAPTLDVELVSFEQIRHGTPRARVALRFSLRDDRRALLERALVVEQSLSGEAAESDAEPLALALSSALSQAVTQLADLTVERLEAAPATHAAGTDAAVTGAAATGAAASPE
jgi:cholesterol transport system auxiliary component